MLRMYCQSETTDITMASEVFGQQKGKPHYEPRTLLAKAIFCSTSKEKVDIVDVSAYVGAATLYLCSCFGAENVQRTPVR